MGSRGLPPKPTALRLLHGDRKDRINMNEPVPAMSEVKPPVELTYSARKVWAELAPDLERKGVLTPWDANAFAVYCDAVVRHREAAKALDEEGMVIHGDRGLAVKSP